MALASRVHTFSQLELLCAPFLCLLLLSGLSLAVAFEERQLLSCREDGKALEFMLVTCCCE